ncbi:hypothetical protein EV356DRAFT_535014 [Viridothelium virens]|uniref:Uncharacterized protein n=1 Tax=Viridothelium virens TaxID=1048519 RepID=A0A6A6H1Q8_VIRVR|nr:hypothetical protein EV356DRAFT_535014 [Viridothelium virens]
MEATKTSKDEDAKSRGDLRDPITSDDSGRPHITQYSTGSKFCVGDKVYLSEPGNRSLVGPLLISSVLGGEKYTLVHMNNTQYENGKQINGGDLEHAG